MDLVSDAEEDDVFGEPEDDEEEDSLGPGPLSSVRKPADAFVRKPGFSVGGGGQPTASIREEGAPMASMSNMKSMAGAKSMMMNIASMNSKSPMASMMGSRTQMADDFVPPTEEEMARAKEQSRRKSIAKKLQKGDEFLGLSEAALRRTEVLHVTEWLGGLREARDFFLKAVADYESQVWGEDVGGGIPVATKSKVSHLKILLEEREAQVAENIEAGDLKRKALAEMGTRLDVQLEYVASMEEGWWMREELHGPMSSEAQRHLHELVRCFNSTAASGVSRMQKNLVSVRDGTCPHSVMAYNLLQRAELLTRSDPLRCAIVESEERSRLRAVTLNNYGCYFSARGKLLPALQSLEAALRLELKLTRVDRPATTHLNLCSVLLRLERQQPALEHAMCAVRVLEGRLRGGQARAQEISSESVESDDENEVKEGGGGSEEGGDQGWDEDQDGGHEQNRTPSGNLLFHDTRLKKAPPPSTDTTARAPSSLQSKPIECASAVPAKSVSVVFSSVMVEDGDSDRHESGEHVVESEEEVQLRLQVAKEERRSHRMVSKKHSEEEVMRVFWDDLGHFASACYNLAVVLDHAKEFGKAIKRYRMASEASAKAWGANHPAAIGMAAAEKDARENQIRRTRGKRGKPAAAASGTKGVEGIIPFGIGFVAGPVTVVAGSRAGVPFGFITEQLHVQKPPPPPWAGKVSLGKYSLSELRELFPTVAIPTPDEHRRRLQDSSGISPILAASSDRQVGRNHYKSPTGSVSAKNPATALPAEQGPSPSAISKKESSARRVPSGQATVLPEIAGAQRSKRGSVDCSWQKTAQRVDRGASFKQVKHHDEHDDSPESRSSRELSASGSRLSSRHLHLGDGRAHLPDGLDVRAAVDGAHGLDDAPLVGWKREEVFEVEARLKPLALESEGGLEGFWSVTNEKGKIEAYHIVKVPVSSATKQENAKESFKSRKGAQSKQSSVATCRPDEGGARSLAPSDLDKTSGVSSRSHRFVAAGAQEGPLGMGGELRPVPGLGGELPPMDPKKAISLERLSHLEKLAGFVYEKVGPSRDRMRMLGLRMVRKAVWRKWHEAQNAANWKRSVDGEEDEEMMRREPRGELVMVSVRFGVSFDKVKSLIAAEFKLSVGSVEINYRDTEGGIFWIRTQQGLDAALEECLQVAKKPLLYCTGRRDGADEGRRSKDSAREVQLEEGERVGEGEREGLRREEAGGKAEGEGGLRERERDGERERGSREGVGDEIGGVEKERREEGGGLEVEGEGGRMGGEEEGEKEEEEEEGDDGLEGWAELPPSAPPALIGDAHDSHEAGHIVQEDGGGNASEETDRGEIIGRAESADGLKGGRRVAVEGLNPRVSFKSGQYAQELFARMAGVKEFDASLSLKPSDVKRVFAEFRFGVRRFQDMEQTLDSVVAKADEDNDGLIQWQEFVISVFPCIKEEETEIGRRLEARKAKRIRRTESGTSAVSADEWEGAAKEQGVGGGVHVTAEGVGGGVHVTAGLEEGPGKEEEEAGSAEEAAGEEEGSAVVGGGGERSASAGAGGNDGAGDTVPPVPGKDDDAARSSPQSRAMLVSTGSFLDLKEGVM